MTPEREGAKKTKINKMPQNEREEDMPETEKCSRIIPSWAIMPSGYEIAQDGSINKRLRGAVVDRGDGQKPAQAPDKVIKVCSSQIYVSNLMYVAESDNAQRIELAFENVHTSKEVKIVMAYEDYTDLTKLRTQLSQFGFMLCSSNAQLVMEYLMAFELSNKDTIPTGSAVTRAGWVDDTHFFPGSCDGLVKDFRALGNYRSQLSCIKTRGDYQEWRKAVMAQRAKSNIFRFVVNSGMAAPLLRKLGIPSYMIHIWGDSQGGKTAAARAALSAWGATGQDEVSGLLKSWNTTEYGAVQFATIFNDLPIGFDEIGESKKREEIQQIAYSLVNGKGRNQGSKDGGLRENPPYTTVIISTGEFPLFTQSDMDGAQNRAIVIDDTPFERTDAGTADAQALHQTLNKNYGYAGPDFVRHLLKDIEHKPDFLETLYDEIMGFFARDFPNEGLMGRLLNAIVVETLADYLASIYIYGRGTCVYDAYQSDRDSAFDAAYSCGKYMAKMMCKSKAERKTTNENAVDYIADWLSSEHNYVCPVHDLGVIGSDVPDTKSGKTIAYDYDKYDAYYIIPSAMRDALSSGGYNPQKTIKYMVDSGIITSHAPDNKIMRRVGCRQSKFYEIKHGALDKAISADTDTETDTKEDT